MKISEIKAQRILSPTQISIAPYAINPYRGCPFACVYCYTQENKAIKKKKMTWGSFIDIKINALELLKEEIKNKEIKRVLLGSTVECYPPQEEKSLITQNIIKILNENNIPVTILTKSCLIQRDLDILTKHKSNKIFLTINFDSENIKNLFEPNSPAIADRLNVLKEIYLAKIKNRVHIAPVIPHIQNIETICLAVGKYSQEISIELYNFKMGNWDKIKMIIKNNFNNKILDKIEKVFLKKENYVAYIRKLEDKTRKIQWKLNKNITLLIPDFAAYYKSDTAYD
jgi:DNA repair photolyase